MSTHVRSSIYCNLLKTYLGTFENIEESVGIVCNDKRGGNYIPKYVRWAIQPLLYWTWMEISIGLKRLQATNWNAKASDFKPKQ